MQSCNQLSIFLDYSGVILVAITVLNIMKYSHYPMASSSRIGFGAVLTVPGLAALAYAIPIVASML